MVFDQNRLCCVSKPATLHKNLTGFGRLNNPINLLQKHLIDMLKNRLMILFWFVMTTAVAQRIKNPCVYESLTRKDKREETLKNHQPIYDFRKGDKLASVGAGGGSKEVIYSMMADSLVFYLQDINPTCLTSETIKATVSQLYNAAGCTCTATFTPVIGTEKETQLPSQFFDKIIIENTLHELTYPSDLLTSIRANLKSDGYLYMGRTKKRDQIRHGSFLCFWPKPT